MSLFVVFPFSRLVHVFSVPVKYVGRSYQIVRKKPGTNYCGVTYDSGQPSHY